MTFQTPVCVEAPYRSFDPVGNVVENQIDDGNDEQRQQRRGRQPADDRDGHRLARLAALGERERDGQRAYERRYRGHQYRAQAQRPGLEDGGDFVVARGAQLVYDVDEQYRVVDDDADEQDYPHEAHDGDAQPAEREQAERARRHQRQREHDRQRVDERLELYRHHHVDEHYREYQRDGHVAEAFAHVLGVSRRHHAVHAVLGRVLHEDLLHYLYSFAGRDAVDVGFDFYRVLAVVARYDVRRHAYRARYDALCRYSVAALRRYQRLEDLLRVVAPAELGAQADVVAVAAVVEGSRVVAAEPRQHLVGEVAYAYVEVVGEAAVQREVDARLVHLEVRRYVDEAARVLRQVLLYQVAERRELFAGRPHDDERYVGVAPRAHLDVRVAVARELLAQAAHYDCGARAQRAVDELDVYRRFVDLLAASAAYFAVGVGDVFVLLDEVDHFLRYVGRHLERGVRRKLELDAQAALVLRREELRAEVECEDHAEDEERYAGRKHERAVAHREAERPLVLLLEAQERAFERYFEARRLMRAPHDARAEERRQRDCDDERYGYRRRDCHAEGVEVAAHHSAHEGDGDEDGERRGSARDDGEGYLVRAVLRGAEGALAHRLVARDVLHYDRRRVDDHADGERNAHHRHVVYRYSH